MMRSAPPDLPKQPWITPSPPGIVASATPPPTTRTASPTAATARSFRPRRLLVLLWFMVGLPSRLAVEVRVEHHDRRDAVDGKPACLGGRPDGLGSRALP